MYYHFHLLQMAAEYVYFFQFYYFGSIDMVTIKTDQYKHLQKLSCISLSPEEEQKLWAQLTDIIAFLGQLPETKNTKSEIQNTKSDKNEGKLTLRTIAGVRVDKDSEKILKNVKHPIINNSIVIKSVLN